jgi:ABC-type methionine transport system permease subunit
MKKLLIIATILNIIHSSEEIIFYFVTGHPTGLPFLVVYIPGQIFLFALLGFAIWKPHLKIFSVAVGIILLYEVVHITTAVKAGTYTPGLATAIPLLILAIPFWTKLLTTNFKKV